MKCLQREEVINSFTLKFVIYANVTNTILLMEKKEAINFTQFPRWQESIETWWDISAALQIHRLISSNVRTEFGNKNLRQKMVTPVYKIGT